MSIRAIIWDLEGVLLQSPDEDAPTTIAHKLNVPIDKSREAFYSDFNDRVDKGEFTHDDFLNHVVDSLGLPREKKTDLLDCFYQDFFIDAGMLSDVRAYHQRYRTALLSNYSDLLRKMLASYWRMDGAFDQIVISWEVRMIKPDPDIFYYTLEKLGCAPAEAIFIDDKAVNVEGARALGMHAILFTGREDMNRRIEAIVAQSKESSPA
ncbi:HAD family hydrolase [Pelolinea submarina]|uniref:Putative hydrolase of the HAD superfamily n=1 Tax=Pelolinea submarina TaxID=913107 RepID=A0A347ZPT1_9CHLR|nr:HAD family phosphatase [Pelolinea submarina]REG04673.1 putative hydrolase of the HAD superfamily [Pelolinea submarina]BBB47312.1 HAD-superfamily hydrolase [Pelolinea submarina]